jgi:DNA invertase Pin-like site-specific DNA recombinase
MRLSAASLRLRLNSCEA